MGWRQPSLVLHRERFTVKQARAVVIDASTVSTGIPCGIERWSHRCPKIGAVVLHQHGRYDEVVSVGIMEKDTTLLTITENGFGKRTKTEEYRVQSRGGKGIFTIKVTKKNGPVVGVLRVTTDDEIIIIASSGKLIRLRAANIRIIGRSTQGVKLINLAKNDKVVSIARVAEKDVEQTKNEELFEE